MLCLADAQQDRNWAMPNKPQQSPMPLTMSTRCLTRPAHHRSLSAALVNKSEAPMTDTHAPSIQASELAELKEMIRKLSEQVEDLASRVDTIQR